MGSYSGNVRGDIHLEKGYNLEAEIDPVELNAAAETFNIPRPFPISGEAKGSLKVKGPLTQPVVTGVAVTTKPSTN